jgi:alpha-tubulin suppressor-like RCC1 family protein
LLSDGTAKCWGDNIYGVLGYGSTDDVTDPAAVGPVSVAANPALTVSKLSAGWYHVCAVLSDGSVKCWGYGHYAELGYGNTENVGDDELPSSVGPVSVTSDPGVSAVGLAEGFLHGCAMLSDGSVKCWGSAMGLGLGSTEAIGDDELPSSVGPVSITANAGVTAVELAAGEAYTCALLSDGTVKCWGSNQHGQLGSGKTGVVDDLPSSVGPVSITTTPGVFAEHLAGGFEHVCALLSDGSVKCWGNNDFGQLGYGNTDVIGDDELPSSVGPVTITTDASVRATAITAGNHHTCALLSNGTVHCWGLGSDGRLGYGDVRTIGDDELPSSVGSVSVTTTSGVGVEQIAAGGNHTCAILSDGSLECWGYNHHGQLGYGNTDNIGDDELPSTVGPVHLLKD